VPVVVVFTKFDRLVIEKAEESEESEDDASEDILLRARQSADTDIDALREQFKVGNQVPPLVTVSGTCSFRTATLIHKNLAVESDYKDTLTTLTTITEKCIEKQFKSAAETLSIVLGSAQAVNPKSKVEISIRSDLEFTSVSYSALRKQGWHEK
jgi:hypothetical protein